jgi:hypothetical protein
MKAAAQRASPANPMLGWSVFLMIAVAGLFYVKWLPYYNRAFVAAANHSIGSSILMGTAASPPAPSWEAALGYALRLTRTHITLGLRTDQQQRIRRMARPAGFRDQDVEP